eukprot:1179230-Prorocentrum_minimum.AAC.1
MLSVWLSDKRQQSDIPIYWPIRDCARGRPSPAKTEDPPRPPRPAILPLRAPALHRGRGGPRGSPGTPAAHQGNPTTRP